MRNRNRPAMCLVGKLGRVAFLVPSASASPGPVVVSRCQAALNAPRLDVWFPARKGIGLLNTAPETPDDRIARGPWSHAWPPHFPCESIFALRMAFSFRIAL